MGSKICPPNVAIFGKNLAVWELRDLVTLFLTKYLAVHRQELVHLVHIAVDINQSLLKVYILIACECNDVICLLDSGVESSIM